MPTVFLAKVAETLVSGALVPGGWIRAPGGEASKKRSLTPWRRDGYSLAGMSLSMVDVMVYCAEIAFILSMKVQYGFIDAVFLDGAAAHQ